MLRKTCTLADFKMTDEGPGSFSGYASTHGTKDLADEIVCKGAFNKHLEKFLAEGFGAVGHDWNGLPVATPRTAHEDAKGLFTEFDFHSTEEAQKARTYVRERLERGKSVGLSIGYTVKDSERTKDALLLKEIELFEVSIVTVPCNPQANATGVKSAETKAQYLGEYASEQMTLAALRNCYDSLFYSALYDILFDWGGARTVDEKITEATAAIDEARSLCVNALRAMMSAADGDDDAKAELEAQFKHVFAVPARTAGRFDRQLLALLTEVEGAKTRAEGLITLRQGQGRPSFSPERHEQLKALSEALRRLVETTAPTPPLDLTLLQMKANARARRVSLAIGANS